MTMCEVCQFWPLDGYPLIEGHHLDCPELTKLLPRLSAAERAAMNALPPDFLERMFRGERPLTDPKTFAN